MTARFCKRSRTGGRRSSIGRDQASSPRLLGARPYNVLGVLAGGNAVSVVLNRDRGLVFGALGAVTLAAAFAVNGALGSSTATSGVAGARATLVSASSVRIDGATIAVTRKGSGACYRGPQVSGCAATLTAGQISYATGRDGKRVVLAGIAGRNVRAVIARLSRGGTVWPKLENGVFYAVLPRGFRLRSLVKVLAGGRRVSFPAKP